MKKFMFPRFGILAHCTATSRYTETPRKDIDVSWITTINNIFWLIINSFYQSFLDLIVVPFLFSLNTRFLTKFHTSLLCNNLQHTELSNLYKTGVLQSTTHYQHTTVTSANNWQMLLMTSWACVPTLVLSTDFPEQSDVLVIHSECLSKLIFTRLKIRLCLGSVEHLQVKWEYMHW